MRYSDAHGHFHTLEPGSGVPEDCGRAVCCGTHPGDWARVLDLAAGDARIVPALGLHPWYIPMAGEDWLEVLADLVGESGAGVGEIGLDRTRRSPPLEVQEGVLRKQLALVQASATPAPVTLHCVRAWGRLLEVLDETVAPGARVLLHGFAAPDAMLPQFLAREGTIFSFGDGARASLLQAVPAERCVFESDAFSGDTRSRPADGAARAIEYAAAIFGEPAYRVAEISGAALERFLGESARS